MSTHEPPTMYVTSSASFGSPAVRRDTGVSTRRRPSEAIDANRRGATTRHCSEARTGREKIAQNCGENCAEVRTCSAWPRDETMMPTCAAPMCGQMM